MVPHGQDWAALCRDYRLRHGLKQEAMAQDFSVDQSTVSRWERGLREPAMHVKQAILNDQLARGEIDADQPLQLLLEMSGTAVAAWDRRGILRGKGGVSLGGGVNPVSCDQDSRSSSVA